MEQGVLPKSEEEKGSYEDVVKNLPLWLEQFPGAGTKVTVSSEDIPYIKESVLHLYSLGIHEVNINCVFEDVWKEGDDVLFENNLRNLLTLSLMVVITRIMPVLSFLSTWASRWTAISKIKTGAELV